MGLSFRRSVRLFPGVRLNFSRSGISTTVGVRGAGLTFGPRGTYAHVGLPGTGLSYRTRVTPAEGDSDRSEAPASSPPTLFPQQPPPVIPPPAQRDVQEIHSGAVSAMTSPGLSELKRLINEAALRKTVLTNTSREQSDDLDKKQRQLAFAKAFIVRLFTKSRVARLEPEIRQLESNLGETRAELEGCYIEVDSELDDAATGTFAALCKSFDALRSCQKIWDITDSAKTDRVKERTTASTVVNRTAVGFDYAELDIVRSNCRSIRLRNASSFEIHLYPGFILTKETGSDFALVEWKDFSVEYAPSRFIETETVPSDSEVVGQAWAKANKDGSPDRRFSGNYQIPIAKYAELWVRSTTGIYEAYMASSRAKGEDFAAAIAHHRDALARISASPHVDPPAESDQPDQAGEPSAPPPEPQTDDKFLIFDWIALGLLVVALGLGGYWISTQGRLLMAKASASSPAVAEAGSPTLVQNTQPAPQLPAVYVAARAVNVRERPATSAQIVGKATHGQKLFVFQTNGAWVQIGTDRPQGWTLARLTSNVPPEGKPPP